VVCGGELLSGCGLLFACLALQAQARTLELREAQAAITVRPDDAPDGRLCPTIGTAISGLWPVRDF